MLHGQSRDADDHTGVDMIKQSMARPLILPDKFSGEEDFSEWTAHFNSVSIVNGWSDDDKYKWLNVHVTGKARVTLTRLEQRQEQPTYTRAIEALRRRFDPPCRKDSFKIDLQLRSKQADESWGDFGDTISLLVDKAYPDLPDEAKDMLALNKFLGELTDPRVALAVRQLRPTTANYCFRSCASYCGV